MFTTKYTQINGAKIPVPKNPIKLPIDKATILPLIFDKTILRPEKQKSSKLDNTVNLHDPGFTPLGSTKYDDPKHFYGIPFTQ